MHHSCFFILGLISGSALAVGGPHDRAHTLTYDAGTKLWVASIPPALGTAEGDLHAIRRIIRDGRYRKALSKLKRWIKTYSPSDARFPRALLAEAQALIGLRKFDEAHEVLQTFLAEFGGMTITSEALRLEFIVAEAYLSGVKRKFMGLKLLSGEDTAYRIFDEISIDYPDDALALAAIKTKADYMFAKGDHALAELEYGRILKEYPKNRYHQYALARTAQSALASFGGVNYDESALIEAQERYNEYRIRYPGASNREGVGLVLSGIREQRAEKEYQTGRYYERTDHLNSAVYYYRLVASDWPDSVASEKAESRLDLLGALSASAVATATEP